MTDGPDIGLLFLVFFNLAFIGLLLKRLFAFAWSLSLIDAAVRTWERAYFRGPVESLWSEYFFNLAVVLFSYLLVFLGWLGLMYWEKRRKQSS